MSRKVVCIIEEHESVRQLVEDMQILKDDFEVERKRIWRKIEADLMAKGKLPEDFDHENDQLTIKKDLGIIVTGQDDDKEELMKAMLAKAILGQLSS